MKARKRGQVSAPRMSACSRAATVLVNTAAGIPEPKGWWELSAPQVQMTSALSRSTLASNAPNVEQPGPAHWASPFLPTPRWKPPAPGNPREPLIHFNSPPSGRREKRGQGRKTASLRQEQDQILFPESLSRAHSDPCLSHGLWGLPKSQLSEHSLGAPGRHRETQRGAAPGSGLSADMRVG